MPSSKTNTSGICIVHTRAFYFFFNVNLQRRITCKYQKTKRGITGCFCIQPLASVEVNLKVWGSCFFRPTQSGCFFAPQVPRSVMHFGMWNPLGFTTLVQLTGKWGRLCCSHSLWLDKCGLWICSQAISFLKLELFPHQCKVSTKGWPLLVCGVSSSCLPSRTPEVLCKGKGPSCYQNPPNFQGSFKAMGTVCAFCCRLNQLFMEYFHFGELSDPDSLWFPRSQ